MIMTCIAGDGRLHRENSAEKTLAKTFLATLAKSFLGAAGGMRPSPRPGGAESRGLPPAGRRLSELNWKRHIMS